MTKKNRKMKRDRMKLRIIIFIIHLSSVFVINKVANTVKNRKQIENRTIGKPNYFFKFFILQIISFI